MARSGTTRHPDQAGFAREAKPPQGYGRSSTRSEWSAPDRLSPGPRGDRAHQKPGEPVRGGTRLDDGAFLLGGGTMGNERTRKLEAAVKHSAAELRDYAASVLGDGEIIGTHQDVAARLRRIA